MEGELEMSTRFQLGDQEIVYNWDLNKFNHLLSNYFSLVRACDILYNDFLEKNEWGSSFFNDTEEFVYQYIEVMYASLSDKLVALGYKEYSFEQATKDPNYYANVTIPLNRALNKFFQELKVYIQLQEQFERDNGDSSGDRAIKKEDGIRFLQAKYYLNEGFAYDIHKVFQRANWSLYNIIIKQVGLYEIELNMEEAETIVDSIYNNSITGDKVFLSLVRALKDFPYNEDIYNLLMTRFNEYYEDIERIGKFFLLDQSEFVFKDYHVFDGFYFDDPHDRQFVIDRIDNPVFRISATLYPHSTELLHKNPEYFIKNHDFPFIDKIITHLQSVTIDPTKLQIAEYHTKKLDFYKKLRTEMEINYIPKYEAVVALSKEYTAFSKNEGSMFTAYSMPNDMLNTVDKYCPKLHKNDQFITFQSDNQAIAVMTTEELVLLNIPLNSSNKERIKNLYLKYEDLTECSLTNQVLTCKKSSGDAVSYIFSLPDRCTSEFNKVISSVIDTDKMTEKLKEQIIAKHRKTESVLSKEELIKRETDILNRTYDGVLYDTQEEVDCIKAETLNKNLNAIFS